MSEINLRNMFPKGSDNKRGPLPKQEVFLQFALSPEGPKYVAYVGGIGSGKSLIGCVTVITWATMYPGDYVIARQYMPELRDTTMKTFLDICPPELLKDFKVQEAKAVIRGVNGDSTVLFRGLEEFNKLRSLNLSGFYIDEANQVSEDAFMLLQGRLRNQSGLRKGIVTTNPSGHDWVYRWFFKKDHINSDEVKKKFALIKAPSTENKHLPEGYVESMLATWSPERIKREIEGSFDAFEGMVYPEFRRDIHVVRPFRVPKEWRRIVGIDHGYRNPTAFIWAAQDGDGDLYVYKEYYEKERTIEENCLHVKKALKGVECGYIDPSTRARRPKDGRSDYDWYNEYLPGFSIVPGNNSKTAGIDRVKSLLKPDKQGKPRIYIFDNCVNLLGEISKYRYAELPARSAGKLSEKEEPMKVDDHALDALRYLVMSLPEVEITRDSIYKKIKYGSIEGSLFREIQGLKNPTKKIDPFKDF